MHVPEIRDDEFTFVYAMNENIYGIRAADVATILASGRDAFVIVSDLKVEKSSATLAVWRSRFTYFATCQALNWAKSLRLGDLEGVRRGPANPFK